MSHQLDESNGRANIAYVGETPWHGLGAKLENGQSIEEWVKSAGLDWSVKEAEALFRREIKDSKEFEIVPFEGRKTLYRSDTGAPLSIMSKDFHVVQPADIIKLYQEIAKAGGFELETMGSLSGGKRIWALARVSEGADVVNRDRVRPYILIATSFDGSMATIVKFTAIRVVCNNTISMAIPQYDAEAGVMQGGGEKDDKTPGRQQIARVLHSKEWNEDVAKAIRLELGIVHSAFERFMVEAKALAAKPMEKQEADDFVAMLLEPYFNVKGADGKKKDVRDTKGYKRILELFNEKAIGRDLAGATRWGMLNAVTQLVDHERGKKDSSRLESAWFGTGNAIKERARELLVGEFSRVE